MNKGSKPMYSVTQPNVEKRKREGDKKEVGEQPSKKKRANDIVNSKFQMQCCTGKVTIPYNLSTVFYRSFRKFAVIFSL